MKQLQHVTTFSLILALIVLSPVVAADAGRQSDGSLIQPDQRRIETPLKYQLTLTQLDGVKAGKKSDEAKMTQVQMREARKMTHRMMKGAPGQ